MKFSIIVVCLNPGTKLNQTLNHMTPLFLNFITHKNVLHPVFAKRTFIAGCSVPTLQIIYRSFREKYNTRP